MHVSLTAVHLQHSNTVFSLTLLFVEHGSLKFAPGSAANIWEFNWSCWQFFGCGSSTLNEISSKLVGWHNVEYWLKLIITCFVKSISPLHCLYICLSGKQKAETT